MARRTRNRGFALVLLLASCVGAPAPIPLPDAQGTPALLLIYEIGEPLGGYVFAKVVAIDRKSDAPLPEIDFSSKAESHVRLTALLLSLDLAALGLRDGETEVAEPGSGMPLPSFAFAYQTEIGPNETPAWTPLAALSPSLAQLRIR